MFKSSAIALLTALSLGVAVKAQTVSAPEPTRVVVRTSDLRASSIGDSRVLLQRIRRAAAKACFTDDRLYGAYGYADCVDAASARAVTSLKVVQPSLTLASAH